MGSLNIDDGVVMLDAMKIDLVRYCTCLGP